MKIRPQKKKNICESWLFEIIVMDHEVHKHCHQC